VELALSRTAPYVGQTGEPLLEVRNLKLWFDTPYGVVEVFRGLNLKIAQGEILGLVGESGCGKSSLAHVILRLLPRNAHLAGGPIIFAGESLMEKSEREMRKIRGKKISMVFQDPMTSLNPVFTVKDQIVKVIMYHKGVDRQTALKQAIDLFKLVELPDPVQVLDSYPHQLSGGMQQRVMIATALSSEPQLVIADEPTTSVDATIQAQILELILRLRNKLGFSVLMITHNLDIVAEVCDRLAVMYAGDIVEVGHARSILKNPTHPYTAALVQAIPRIPKPGAARQPLRIIRGVVPDLYNRSPGCSFNDRCDYAMRHCSTVRPPLFEVQKDRYSACHLFGD